MYDVVIIGGGIAGLTAAIYLRRAGKSVLVCEEKVCGGQIVNTLAVENWPGFAKISGAELIEKIYHQAHNLGVEIKYETVLEVTETEEYDSASDAAGEVRKLWAIRTDEGEYMTRAVILATGTRPRELSDAQMQEVGERPVSYCATCDGALYKGQSVVVVGSGNTARNEIKYLEGIASKVYHIHHDDPVPEEAKAVFVAIGRVPATVMFEKLVDLDADGYVVAGEDCRTSRPGILVAGDCRAKSVRQLVTAASDGAVAAAAALDYLK